MPGQIRKMKLKVCLVGERAVGKTSLIQRYVYNTFEETYRGTLGSKLYLLSFSKYVAADQIVEAQIALFDLMGEHAPRDAFRDAMFWGAHGFLAVADMGRPDTMYQLPAWRQAVQTVAGDIPFSVLINKSDSVPGGAIGPRETQWLINTFPGIPFVATSAKTGLGVGNAFQGLLERIVDAILAKSRARQQVNAIADRLLGFAHKRGAAGVTKTELLLSFKGTDYNALMNEVKALDRLGYISIEEMGPANFRILLTPEGEAVVLKTGREEFVIEEPT